jgi:hypothetical protein
MVVNEGSTVSGRGLSTVKCLTPRSMQRLSYWARQLEAIDARVEPLGFSLEPDGRVVVDVHQVVRDRSGALVADCLVQHVYYVRDGLVASMEVREPQPPAGDDERHVTEPTLAP